MLQLVSALQAYDTNNAAAASNYAASAVSSTSLSV
jgi:hypothetical protein